MSLSAEVDEHKPVRNSPLATPHNEPATAFDADHLADGSDEMLRPAADKLGQSQLKQAQQAESPSSTHSSPRLPTSSPGASVEPTVEPKLQSTTSLLPPGRLFYIGTWRRSPFDPSVFPQTLNGGRGTAALSDIDAEGVLWAVVPSEAVPTGFVLRCEEAGDECWLSDDLSMVTRESEAALWRYVPEAPFRGLPGDVSIRIVHHKSNMLLCSNETSGMVSLMTEDQANHRNPTGEFVTNVAWELHMDEAGQGDDEWLGKYIQV